MNRIFEELVVFTEQAALKTVKLRCDCMEMNSVTAGSNVETMLCPYFTIYFEYKPVVHGSNMLKLSGIMA